MEEQEIPSHHQKHEICTTRAKYREGNNAKAVKVYTVHHESKYLLIQGIPAVGAITELVKLCALYGPVEEYRIQDDYPADEFTEVIWIKFKKIQNARYAKKKLDDYSFFGGVLHVCYAPEYESINETREKLQDRRKVIAMKTRAKTKIESRTAQHNVNNKGSVQEEVANHEKPQVAPSIGNPATSSQSPEDKNRNFSDDVSSSLFSIPAPPRHEHPRQLSSVSGDAWHPGFREEKGASYPGSSQRDPLIHGHPPPGFIRHAQNEQGNSRGVSKNTPPWRVAPKMPNGAGTNRVQNRDNKFGVNNTDTETKPTSTDTEAGEICKRDITKMRGAKNITSDSSLKGYQKDGSEIDTSCEKRNADGLIVRRDYAPKKSSKPMFIPRQMQMKIPKLTTKVEDKKIENPVNDELRKNAFILGSVSGPPQAGEEGQGLESVSPKPDEKEISVEDTVKNIRKRVQQFSVQPPPPKMKVPKKS